ncbi:MAG: hypothetical protein HND56_09400 [Pseudomonadota bacterium]|nr:hypothetical protein [Pseudomonadota bacterium]QKK05890.1 MAG: hypothetical protein HND56_09400 [Pseudomonadota bacterium]
MLRKLSVPVFWGLSIFLVYKISGLCGLGRIPLIVYFAHLIAAPLLFLVCGFCASASLHRAVLYAIAAGLCYAVYIWAVLAGQYGVQVALLRLDAVLGAASVAFLTIILQALLLRFLPEASTKGTA